VLLYEMLAGHLPFQRDGVPATLYAIVHDPPIALADICNSDSGGGSAALQQQGMPREAARAAMWVAVVVRVRELRASGIAGVSDG